MDIEGYMRILKKYPRDQKVRRGFGEIYSWRGSYDEAAVGIEQDTTVGEMLDAAKYAIGTKMTGYKGGTYNINADTTLNVEEYGEYTDGSYCFYLLMDLMLDDTANQKDAEIAALRAEVKSLKLSRSGWVSGNADEFLAQTNNDEVG